MDNKVKMGLSANQVPIQGCGEYNEGHFPLHLSGNLPIGIMSCVLSRLTQQPLLISALHLLLDGRLHHLNFHVLQELHHVYSPDLSVHHKSLGR